MAFAADWLALREPADRAARDAGLLAEAAAAAGPAPVVLDLGSGTGSTRRSFDGLLPDARWRLLDSDPALLDVAAAEGGDRVECIRHDLNDVEALPLDGVSLVTASALLDLVSEDWLERLARVLSARGVPFYAALTYDGVMRWTAPRPGDDAVVAAFNAHMTGDKGFGPALGPGAADAAAGPFRRAGYIVAEAPSPWRLGPDEAALQRAFLEGVATAAREAGRDDATEWNAARQEAIADSRAEIGHRDLFARPPTATT
ncbi:class I SAM-dependent methyltransferase [Roseivivax isoporae]|uniref:Methyltransferase domain-containing protein n=1 Tax=Roseivivax isoporae LMG 25204 TaxID=1449351 RepID=X7F7M6_9RHOB|nr:class I SAM-dependent methyltransferase [Roseivivax isoporae]ETX28927.1 hypothetical protein RISW2_04230 [Roseivivax isoporae LMG 25204]